MNVNPTSASRDDRKLCIGIFIVLMVLQVLLFRTFVAREVAPDPVLRGDPTWYTYFCYDTHDAMIHRDWGRLAGRASTSPWGVLLFLQAGIAQMFFGAGREGVLSLNLVYYLAAQVFTFWFFARLARSYWGGLVAVGLLLAVASPFRSGPALNMRDFHFDLVLMFLLILSCYAVAVSDCFRRTGWSVVLAVVCAYIVAVRLVSVTLFAGAFGAFLLVLLWVYLFGAKGRRPVTARRLRNFWIAAAIFAAASALPIWVARHALYNHYLRYVFDEGFRKAREGLYVMGAHSKLQEAYVVAKAVFAWDLGVYFAVGLALVVIWALLWRLRRPEAGRLAAPAGEAADRQWLRQGDPNPDTPGLGTPPADRRLFVAFLICSAVTSYAMHVAYTIKSDHMTRATAAPILVSALVILVPWMTRTLLARRRGRAGMIVAAALAIAVGMAENLRFYTGPGRGREYRGEMPAMAALFNDLAAIADDLHVRDLAISVDTVESFSLGNCLNYCNYEYEHKGVLRGVIPRLGVPVDEPVDKETALRLLGESDVVVLSREQPPPSFPLAESIRPMRQEIREFVTKRFAYYSTHVIFGIHRDVFCRREWKVTASASTEARYGPEKLLSETVQIWHAPWDGQTPRWLEFTSPDPVRLERIVITAQDGGPDRAPRAFVLQAASDSDAWTDLLEVRDAAFSLEHMDLDWPVRQEAPARRFRLYITENCGAPTLLTIQKIRLVCSQSGSQQPLPG